MINKYRISKAKLMELALETLFYNGFTKGEYFIHDGKKYVVSSDPMPNILSMTVKVTLENTEYDNDIYNGKYFVGDYSANDIIQGYSNIYDDFECI